MGNPYVSEIRMFGGTFAPVGWFFCDGSLKSISDYDVLYALLGTTYGGDGQNTFGLPDLRGRVPIHNGQGTGLSPYVRGQAGGSESVTLTTAQLPPHTHPVFASTSPGSLTGPGPTAVPASPQPSGGVTAGLYVIPGSSTVNPAAMAASAVGATGGNLPHENRMPYLAVNFIISWTGVYPQQP